MKTDLKPEVLGQLLLMQSTVGSLPDEKTIFAFVRQGLHDLPGVSRVESNLDGTVVPVDSPDSLSIEIKNSPGRQLSLFFSDRDAFEPYLDYLKNFCFMLSVILEERNQRKLNQSHRQNLANHVAERTRDLEKEVRERKKAEEALYESEKLFRTSFEYAAIGKCLVSPDGKLLKVNKAFTEIVGYPASELVGRNVGFLNHPEDTLLNFANFQALIQGKQDTVFFEKRYIHASGKTVWVTVGSFLLHDKDGSPQFFITNVEDITAYKRAERERDKLEERLRQAHKMEAIGTLAGGIAHDFNNLLAVIIGYSDLAAEEIPEFSSARSSIEQVQNAALRAKDLVQQILTFSHKQQNRLAPLKIKPVIVEILRLLRASIPTSVEITANIAPECGSIMGDPAQIDQILVNLCTNAVQAMEDEEGTLTVELYNEDLSIRQVHNNMELLPGNYVVLVIRDTGVGIKDDQLERIFDPYFTTRGVGRGSGMGLAMVHGLVKGHKGVIEVNSKVGEGSAFKVYFPRIKELSEEATQKKAATIPPGTGKILVVDDETRITNMLERSISRLGYVVKATNSSQKALELFNNNPGEYDLVITDQTMPDLSGEKLSRKLLAIRPDIPIIMCTGYSTRMSKEKSEVLGISTFLLKPVSRAELAEAIRKNLDKDKSAANDDKSHL